MTVRRPSPMLCLAAACMLAGVAHADDGRRSRATPPPDASALSRTVDPAPRVLRSDDARGGRAGRHDALSDSVRRVQSRTGGQVLSAERVPFEGRDINRVKVVDDRGRVRVYMDDPSSRPRRPPRPTRGDDD